MPFFFHRVFSYRPAKPRNPLLKVLLGVVDTRGIEGVVNGVPRAIGRLSTSLRRLQDGQVAHYLAWLAGGVTALLLVLQLGFFS